MLPIVESGKHELSTPKRRHSSAGKAADRNLTAAARLGGDS
jgi:hypothetical protein